MYRLVREDDGLLQLANLIVPADLRDTGSGRTAGLLLRNKLEATGVVLVDLHTLLVTQRTSAFMTSASFAALGERPQTLTTLAVAIADFVERLVVTRSPGHIVFSADNAGEQHPLQVARAATAVASHSPLQTPYSRSADTMGFLPLVLSAIAEQPAPSAEEDEMLARGLRPLPLNLITCPLGTVLTRGGLLLDELLMDRRIAPVLFSLVFQCVFAELLLRVTVAIEQKRQFWKNLTITYAGAVFDFGNLCRTGHKYLPNAMRINQQGVFGFMREPAFYSLSGPVSCLLLLLEGAHAVNREQTPASAQFEVLSDSDAMLQASVLYHVRRTEEKDARPAHGILLWHDDFCLVEAEQIFSVHIPAAMVQVNLPGSIRTVLIFLTLVNAYFGSDFCSAPAGFRQTGAAFTQTLQQMKVIFEEKMHGTSLPAVPAFLGESMGRAFAFVPKFYDMLVRMMMTAHLRTHGFSRNTLDQLDNESTRAEALASFVDRFYPDWHPLRVLMKRSDFAQFEADTSPTSLTPERLNALSVGLLQIIKPPRGWSAERRSYEPVESDFPHLINGSAFFQLRVGIASWIVGRNAGNEEEQSVSLKITVDKDERDVFDAVDDLTWQEQMQKEITAGISQIAPCPLEFSLLSRRLRVVGIWTTFAMLTLGHRHSMQRTYLGRNNGLVKGLAKAYEILSADDHNPAWTYEVPQIKEDPDDTWILIANTDANTGNMVSVLTQCGLPVFASYPGAAVGDTVLRRRLDLLRPDADELLADLLDEAAPKWRQFVTPGPNNTVPPVLAHALMRCAIADEHAGATDDDCLLELPYGLVMPNKGTIFYPTTRTPEIPLLVNTTVSSGAGGGFFAPFVYHPTPGWTAQLQPPMDGFSASAVTCPAVLVTEDSFASAVCYADNNEDFEDAVNVAVTGLYLESLHERVHRHPRVAECELLAYQSASSLSAERQLAFKAGATRRLRLSEQSVGTAQTQRLISFSPDVVAYAAPLVARTVPEHVWQNTVRPVAHVLRRPMEAAFHSLCLWKTSEIVLAGAVAAAHTHEEEWVRLRAMFGRDAREASRALMVQQPWAQWAAVPAEQRYGTWCTAALALKRVDLIGAAVTPDQFATEVRSVTEWAHTLALLVPVPHDAAVRLTPTPGAADMVTADILLPNWAPWAAQHYALFVASVIARAAGVPLASFAAAPVVLMPDEAQIAPFRRVAVAVTLFSDRNV